jgi:hypothetical protein
MRRFAGAIRIEAYRDWRCLHSGQTDVCRGVLLWTPGRNGLIPWLPQFRYTNFAITA